MKRKIIISFCSFFSLPCGYILYRKNALNSEYSKILQIEKLAKIDYSFQDENYNNRQNDYINKKTNKKKVVIIGGGVIGVTSAYFLCKNNFDVVLIERCKEVAQGFSNKDDWAWLLNMLFNLSDKKYNHNKKAMKELQYLSGDLLYKEIFKDIPREKLESTVVDNFCFLNETTFQNWVQNNNKEIIGIKTNKGFLFGDKFVVAAGNFTPNILNKLKVICPILPVKGYSITVEVPEKMKQFKYLVGDEENKKINYLGQIGNVYRNSAMAEIYERENYMKKYVSEKIGNFDKYWIWVGLRPVSPDDLPIISEIENVPSKNVFVNSGQGSRGLIQSFGCAKLLSEIMTKNITHPDLINYFDLKRFYFSYN